RRGSRDEPRRVGGPQHPPLGGLHARWFVLLLRVLRRPRGVGESRRLVLLRELEERVERPCRVVHARPGIALLREPIRNGLDRESGRVASLDLVPAQWSGDAGVGRRPHGVRRGDRAVLRVLVVVEKDAVTLLLPPFA